MPLQAQLSGALEKAGATGMDMDELTKFVKTSVKHVKVSSVRPCLRQLFNTGFIKIEDNRYFLVKSYSPDSKRDVKQFYKPRHGVKPSNTRSHHAKNGVTITPLKIVLETSSGSVSLTMDEAKQAYQMLAKIFRS